MKGLLELNYITSVLIISGCGTNMSPSFYQMWQLEEICEQSHLQYEVIFSLNKLFYECIPILLCKKPGDQIKMVKIAFFLQ